MSASEHDFTTISDSVKACLMPDESVDNVVLTVGSVLRGDDAAAPYLAKMIEDNPIDGWTLVHGDLTPEDELGYIRMLEPNRVVVVDAADMNLRAGEVRIVTKDDVAKQFFITTHSMPITYLLSELEPTCRELVFIGIQPAQTEFFGPLSDSVREAVENIYEMIKTDTLASNIEKLAD